MKKSENFEKRKSLFRKYSMKPVEFDASNDLDDEDDVVGGIKEN